MSQVQTITGNSGSTSGTTASVGTAWSTSNITSGNRIVVYVSATNVGGTDQSVTVSDSAGNVYTQLLHNYYFGISGKGGGPSVWLSPITLGSGTKPTVTVAMTSTGATFCEVVFSAEERTEAFTGLDGTGYATSPDVGNFTAHPAGTTAASTASSEYVVSIYAGFSFTTPTITVGSSTPTLTKDTNLSVTQFLGVASGSSTSGTANTASWTSSVADVAVALIFALTTGTSLPESPVLWQSINAKTGAGSHATVAATFVNNVGGHNGQPTKILCGVSMGTGVTTNVTGMQDGSGNVMIKIAAVTDASVDLELWAMDTPAGDIGTTPTITVSVSPGANINMLLEEVGNLAVGNTLAAMIDGIAGTNISNNIAIPNNVAYSSTAVGEYLALLGADDGESITYTIPTGYVDDPNSINNVTSSALSIAHKSSTGGSESTHYTTSSTEPEWAQILVAFKSAGSTPPPAVPDTSAPTVDPPFSFLLPPIGPPPLRAFIVGLPQVLLEPGSANPPIFDSSVAPTRPPGDVAGLPPIGPPPLRQFLIGLPPVSGSGPVNLINTQVATARIANSFTSTQSAISRIANSFTNTQSAVARINNTAVTKTQTALARISKTPTSTQSAISRIAHSESLTQSAVSRISKSFTNAQSAVARIKNTAVINAQTATARVKNTAVTVTQTAIARVAHSETSTQSAIARVSHGETKTQSVVARISNTITSTQPAVARVKNTAVINTQSAIARVKNTAVVNTQPATARISHGESTTQTALARIAHSETITQGAVSRVSSVITKTQAAIAHINAAGVENSSQTAVARISKTLITTQSTVSRISKTLINAQSAIVRISKGFTSTQSSVARVSKTFTNTQSAVTHIVIIGSKTQPAISRVSSSVSSIQPSVARVVKQVTTTQTAVAHIASPLGSTKTQTATVRVVASVTKNQPATASVGLQGQSIQSAVSRIATHPTKTQTAIARIGTIHVIGVSASVSDPGPAFSVSVVNPTPSPVVSSAGDVTITSVVVTG